MDTIRSECLHSILFCIDSMNGGGAEKLLLRYITILQCNRQLELTILVLNDYGILMHEIPSYVKVLVENKMSSEERVAFNDLNFDIEIAFLESQASLYIARKKSNAYKVGWIHTDMFNNNWCKDCFPYGQQESIYESLDSIVCINAYCKDCFVAAFPSTSHKVVICNNILDFEALDLALNTSSIEDNALPTFTFIGRLVADKHPELAILSLMELLRRGRKIKLSIIGDGYYHKPLKELCYRYGLEANVNFYGYLSNPYNVMRQSTAILSLSDIEGGPLTIAEAYYMGIPSISTHSGGADAFMAAYGGVIMADKETTSLANIMESLLQNQVRNTIIDQIDRQLIRQNFSEANFLCLIDQWLTMQYTKRI